MHDQRICRATRVLDDQRLVRHIWRMGVGLFIVHGLLAAMGGRIWVDSAEGGGSSFTFELPAAVETTVDED